MATNNNNMTSLSDALYAAASLQDGVGKATPAELHDLARDAKHLERKATPTNLKVGNGADVCLSPNGTALWMRLPIPVPCDGCKCDWCKANPNEIPSWDTLSIPLEGGHAHTVHAPEFWRPMTRESATRWASKEAVQ
jgi:hypothetical protein